MTTILDVLEKGAAFLAEKGIEDPRLNMELLVAHELGLQRMDLYLRFDQPLENEILEHLRKKLKKRGQGIPIQHINGIIHFRNFEILCDPRALIPRPETEELVDLVLTHFQGKKARILDLGCGTGAIGLSLGSEMGTRCEQLVLADLFTDALDLARENANKLGIQAEFTQTDLFSNLTGTFDIIAANLPYVAERDRDTLSPEVGHDPDSALFSGEDGLDLIRQFCQEVSPFLTNGGLLVMEVGHDQGEIVCGLLRENGLHQVELHKDLAGITRFPLARSIKT